MKFLTEELESLRAQNLLRETAATPPAGLVLCSNDYLGLAEVPATRAAGLPGGSGAAALVTGYHEAHRVAEAALAEWVGLPASLLFSSGYCANVGVVSALAGPPDLVLSDRLNHASIIDGCRLSRATVQVFEHCSLDDATRQLEQQRSKFRRAFVVTESYFGMDATTADLRSLRALCDRYDAALIVDEAHSLGVFGSEGGGLCRSVGVVPDVLIGTLGKAVGLHGAFAAGRKELRTFLWNRARSFVFSTATSPASAAEIPERVQLVRAADDRRRDLLDWSAEIRTVLASGGQEVFGDGPIIPWILGEATSALAVQRRLLEQGVVGLAIRPPTVPLGQARVRLAARAGLTHEQRRLARQALTIVAQTG
jgi:8-amino-7-oxononanoate synthase